MKKPHNMVERRWMTAKGVKKIAYYHRGKRPLRKMTALGTDYAEALKKWAAIEGVETENPKKGSLADLYKDFLEWAQNRELSKLSIRRIKDYQYYWGNNTSGRIKQVFGDMDPNSLRPEWMLHYFESRTSQVGAKKELKFLSVMLNWGKARGRVKIENPLTGIMRLMKIDESRGIYVEDLWYKLAFDHGSQLVKDTLEFTYLCANRPDESAKARFTDIDGDELVIRLAKTERKGLGEKRIHIAPELATYIERQKRKVPRSMYLISDGCGQPLKPNQAKFKREWKEARDKAEAYAKERNLDFVRFQLKDVRAKAGTDIARDYGIEAARLALGHTTQKQTQDYVRSVKGAQKKALSSEIVDHQA